MAIFLQFLVGTSLQSWPSGTKVHFCWGKDLQTSLPIVWQLWIMMSCHVVWESYIFLNIVAIITITAALNGGFVLAHFRLRWFLLCHTLLTRCFTALRFILLPTTVLNSVFAIIFICCMTNFAPPICTFSLITCRILSFVHIFAFVLSCGICSGGGCLLTMENTINSVAN